MSLDALPAEVGDAAAAVLLAMADDEFVAGHRATDWLAVAPTMEEDNAFAGIAQDELGHARLWYDLVAEGLGTTLDDLALNRPPADRSNTVLVEAEHADFADAVAVNYVYDAAEVLLLEALRDGGLDGVVGRAEQALNEEPFHREHADLWLDRLVATSEGRERLTRAFEDALPRAADLFAFDDEAAALLVEGGVLAESPSALEGEWAATVRSRLADLPLDVSASALDAMTEPPETNGRAGEHTDDLAAMIAHMHPDNVVGDHPINRYEGSP